MTPTEWIDQARRDATDLRYLLQRYHPRALADGQRNPRQPITAHEAERACAVVREKIAAETEGLDVLRAFDTALEDADISTINDLLNAAWFGVPESTACWSITGFKQAVDLMENVPEEVANA